MYKFVDNAEIKPYRNFCSDTLIKLRDILKEKHEIITQPILVGSGAKNLVTRNGNGPFDLDYNLEIINMPEKYWNNLAELKNIVIITLNRIVGKTLFSNGRDSRSVITSLLHFDDSPNLKFSFDIAIISKNKNGNYCRLIHEKYDWTTGRFYWNEVPSSKQVGKKAAKIKSIGYWNEVRNRYLELKNLFLSEGDYNHPSFVVYVEAVNEIYQKYCKG